MNEQQAAAFEAIKGMVERVSMRIVELPIDQRPAAIATAKKVLQESMRDFGFDPQIPPGSECVDLIERGLQILTRDMPSGGKA